jgi:hypothetical protein
VSDMPIRIAERDMRGSIAARPMADSRANRDTPGPRAHGLAFLAAEYDSDAAWRRGKGRE